VLLLQEGKFFLKDITYKKTTFNFFFFFSFRWIYFGHRTAKTLESVKEVMKFARSKDTVNTAKFYIFGVSIYVAASGLIGVGLSIPSGFVDVLFKHQNYISVAGFQLLGEVLLVAGILIVTGTSF